MAPDPDPPDPDPPDPDPVDLVAWARATAEHYLAGESPQRWKHVQGVARRAGEIAGLLPPHERGLLVAAAWLHDVGYAGPLAESGFHPLDGARFLAAQHVPRRLCGLVAHHSAAGALADDLGLGPSEFDDEHTVLRDALWYCDATVGPEGQRMSFSERLDEAHRRHGADHPATRASPRRLPPRRAAVRRIERLLGDEPRSDEPHGDEPHGDEPHGDEPHTVDRPGCGAAPAGGG